MSNRISELVENIISIEKSIIRSDIEKAWTKHQIGQEVQHKDGTRWRKVSDTGDSKNDWKLVTGSKDKEGGESGDSKENKYKPSELKKFAKTTSEANLEAAVKNSPDPDIRQAAHKELDRREHEEHVQKKEDKKESKTIKKGFEQWL